MDWIYTNTQTYKRYSKKYVLFRNAAEEQKKKRIWNVKKSTQHKIKSWFYPIAAFLFSFILCGHINKLQKKNTTTRIEKYAAREKNYIAASIFTQCSIRFVFSFVILFDFMKNKHKKAYTRHCMQNIIFEYHCENKITPKIWIFFIFYLPSSSSSIFFCIHFLRIYTLLRFDTQNTLCLIWWAWAWFVRSYFFALYVSRFFSCVGVRR